MMAHELLSNLFPCVDANNVTTNSPPPSTKEQEQEQDKDENENKAGEQGPASLPCLASEDADYSDTSCEDDTNNTANMMEAVAAVAAVESSSSTSTTSSTASAVPVLPFAHVATPEIVQELNQWEAEMKQQYDKVLPPPLLLPVPVPVPPPINTTPRRSIVGGNEKEGSASASAVASASALSPSPLTTTTTTAAAAAAAATMPMLLSWADISIETVLGEGAFSFVFQVQVASKSKSQNTTTTTADTTTTTTTTTATPQQPQPQQPQHYALKCLKAKAISETQEFLFNAMDLQVEALILSRVRHEHIIQLRGWSSSSSFHHNNNNSSSLGESYQTTDGAFLLLEIMETTLLDKLGEWRRQIMQQQQQQHERRARRRRNCDLLSKDAVLQRLLTIALPVLSAMEYLHSHRIVLRDLKPENIGFDATHHHTVKLFDFGLARIVDTVPQDDIAGSVCYMAPEILLSQGTQLKSDVYSMAMVLWELCTLDLPMARFQTMEQIQQRVAKGQWRPSVSGIPVKRLRNHKSSVITRGWATKPDDRPTAKEMEQELEQIIICGEAAAADERDFLDSSVSSGMGLSVHSMPPASRSTTNISVKMTAATNGNTITNSKEQQQQQQQQRKIPKRAHSFGFFFQKKK